MTAEEARKLTDKSRILDVDTCSIYHYIDSEIERCATKGKSIAYINIKECNYDWETISTKRDKIIERYEKLGYSIINTGYYRNIKSDTFVIEW